MASTNSVALRRNRTVPSTIVELSVSASGIRDADTFSKSDPFCVLLVKDFGQSDYRELCRTEVIDNNLNPHFAKKFVLDYFFEEKQFLRFELYHESNRKSHKRQDQAFLGAMECTLGKIVSCIKVKEPLIDDSKRKSTGLGELLVVSEQKNPSVRDEITLVFSGESLDKKDLLGKSDPFLEISKETEDGTFIVVHRTEVIKKSLKPSWKPFTLSLGTMCNGDHDRPIQMRCLDWNKSGKEDLIGQFETSVRILTRGPSDTRNVYPLVNPKLKQKKKDKYTSSGLIRLERVSTETQSNFLDYIRGGTQVKVVISVDFTQSNGDPKNPTSLHYFQPGGDPNQYARAIKAVVEVLEDYDTDKLIPAFGFGAKVRGSEECCNFFPLNGDSKNPDCQGTQGVLDAYYKALQDVELFGPTNFAPTISYVAGQAQEKLDGSEYHILLILTDGILTDMEDTKKTIVQASRLPLSIIIVGIGNEDFSAMEILDGDHHVLSYKKEKCIRDIVQFVPFQYYDTKDLSQGTKAQLLLTKDVLAEVPEQLTSFMQHQSIRPVRRKSTRV